MQMLKRTNPRKGIFDNKEEKEETCIVSLNCSFTITMLSLLSLDIRQSGRVCGVYSPTRY